MKVVISPRAASSKSTIAKRLGPIFVFVCLLPGVLLPAGSAAQQPKKIPRIGYLAASTAAAHSPRVTAFRQGLSELGYVEGQNILIEFRYAGGSSDRLFELAAELVRLNVDLIVSTGTEGAVAARQATRTIPIVMRAGLLPVSPSQVGTLPG